MFSQIMSKKHYLQIMHTYLSSCPVSLTQAECSVKAIPTQRAITANRRGSEKDSMMGTLPMDQSKHSHQGLTKIQQLSAYR